MKHFSAFPTDVLQSHIGILGKTGSGKSNAAKVIAEYLMLNDARVCVVDPTDTWWGLRLSQSGKRASDLHPIIFGGEHADIPITEQHGILLAESVATSSDSSIISVRQMTVGQRTRFFTDFAETLLRVNKGPLHLIIDEAHVFAPQGRVSDPQSGKMLHAANNLISLGRGIGLKIILISQRPAKIHKDAITQVETLIAMRLIAPQDRKAVKEWIVEWADSEENVVNTLPALKVGESWVWSPQVEFLEQIKFPIATTFDSGRATNESAELKLAPINLDAINERMKQIKEEADANDVSKLKARIADLESELENELPGGTDVTELKAQYDNGYAEGWNAGAREEKELRQRILRQLFDRLMQDFINEPSVAKGYLAEPINDSDKLADHPQLKEMLDAQRRRESGSILQGLADVYDATQPKPRNSKPAVVNGANPFLEAARKVWPVKLTWGALGALTGLKTRGGSFNTRRKEIIEGGLATEQGGLLVLTNPPAQTKGVKPVAILLEALPSVSNRMFRYFLEHSGHTLEQMARGLGIQPRGGSWNSGVSILKKNDLIVASGSGWSVNRNLL